MKMWNDANANNASAFSVNDAQFYRQGTVESAKRSRLPYQERIQLKKIA